LIDRTNLCASCVGRSPKEAEGRACFIGDCFLTLKPFFSAGVYNSSRVGNRKARGRLRWNTQRLKAGPPPRQTAPKCRPRPVGCTSTWAGKNKQTICCTRNRSNTLSCLLLSCLVSPGGRNRPVRHTRAGAPRATSLVLQVEDGPVEHIVVLETFPVEELLEEALSRRTSRCVSECSHVRERVNIYASHRIASHRIASHRIALNT